MKLIALHHLHRVPALAKIEIPDAPHSVFIPKGTQFDIGTSEDFDSLEPDEQLLVAKLAHAKGIALASDEKIVARIQAEIAIDAKREANLAVSNQKLLAGGLGLTLMNLLADAQRVAAARGK